jgi:fatty acid desaturase
MAKHITKKTVDNKLSMVAGTQAYTELREIVLKKGVLDRSYGYYTFMILFAYGGFFLSGYNVFTLTALLPLVASCIVFAFFTVQIAGILHDAGHRAIFKSTLYNDILGTICGTLISMVHENWRTRHNTHHANTNVEEVDPDINIPLLSFTQERLRSKSGISKFLLPYQAILYLPIGVLVGTALRIDGIRFYKKYWRKEGLWKVSLYIVGLFAWFIMPFLIFPLAKAVLVFLLVHFTVGFYAWNIFAPNHKGNPHFEKGLRYSFLEHQIMTSRNIHGHWLTDTMYMGLNYQIEHHLFPSCPRNKLKLIMPHVKKIARKLKLDYEQVSVWESNKIILSELMVVSQGKEHA